MTIDYYNRNAEAFRQRTGDCDLQQIYEPFLSRLPTGAHILDAGCGPGRDTVEFLRRGFRVTGFDGSQAMAQMATAATGQKVLHLPFEQVAFHSLFDGIWACASLLHVPLDRIDDVLRRLTRAMKPDGIFYMSVKLGDGERVAGDGRLFCDYTESSLREVLDRHPSLEILNIWQTPMRPGQIDGKGWLHALTRRANPADCDVQSLPI